MTNLERIQLIAVAQEMVDANRSKFKFEELEAPRLLDIYVTHIRDTRPEGILEANIVEALYGLLRLMVLDKEMDTGWWGVWGNTLDHILFVFERNYLEGEPSPPYHFAFPIEKQRMFELVRRITARYIHAQR